MIPPNPLTHIHVDRFANFAEPAGSAGEEEIERRVQELLNEWLEFYFSGNPFQTPVSNATEQKTLTKCGVIWDQASMPNPAVEPILHMLLIERRDGEPTQAKENLWRHDGRWTWNVILRVPPQLAVSSGVPHPAPDAATLNAGRLCRRVGDQCRWLLESSHVQELAAKGIYHLRVDSGPRQIPGGAWHLRQIVFSATITYHQRSNMPL